MFQIEQLKKLAGEKAVKVQEPISAHTTFRIGGPAKCFVTPVNQQDFEKVLTYCIDEKEKYFIIGNGSNLLVSDQGYDGVIISTRGMQQVTVDKNPQEDGTYVVKAESGVLLSALASQIAKENLAGFEFASGIPGTLGGAVTMNAGAYGGEIKDVILDATVLRKDGTVKKITKEELHLAYRHSVIQEQDLVCIGATFAFKKGNPEEIKEKTLDFNQRRRDKQPLEFGSAGSTFKRPEGYFAGKLIQDAGLRGYRVGDVMVSEKHCGFVVNVGNGTCAQAKEVIEHVQKTVQDQFGVWLELEVKQL